MSLVQSSAATAESQMLARDTLWLFKGSIDVKAPSRLEAEQRSSPNWLAVACNTFCLRSLGNPHKGFPPYKQRGGHQPPSCHHRKDDEGSAFIHRQQWEQAKELDSEECCNWKDGVYLWGQSLLVTMSLQQSEPLNICLHRPSPQSRDTSSPKGSTGSICLKQ